MTSKTRQFVREWWIPALVGLLLSGLVAVLVSCTHEPDMPVARNSVVDMPLRFASDTQDAPEPLDVSPARPESDRRYREHPQGWLKSHNEQAKSDPNNCAECHGPEYCIACHEDNIPETHKSRAYVSTHGKAALKDPSECRTCHTDTFCDACHQTARPSSHDQGWLTSHTDGASCKTCHTQSYCDSCHGMQMPHPSNWLTNHAPTANKDESACLKCHTQQYCTDCHATLKPSTHDDEWEKKHGTASQAEGADCATCHTQQYCTDCHGGVELPHPEGYLMKHKDMGASLEKDSACFKCHEQKYCDVCHSVLNK